MHKQKWILSLLIVLLCCSKAIARPKVGLALGGGGAKGGAHIAVIRLLEEYQIPIDYVSGTSMGAYVGGLLAMGYSADEIEDITFSIDWNSGFIDKVDRSDLSLRKKKQQDDYQIGLPFGANSEGIQLPQGVVQGQTMASLLRSATHNLEALDSFDDLAIPFRAIATNMETVTPVVLDQGDLAKVMQASMSVPGALRPIDWNQQMLSDGGVVNNLPIDVLLTMGADIIIAVDISADLKPQSELSSGLDYVSQLITHLTRSSTQRQIALLRADDILISPDMQGIDTAAFDLMKEAIRRGEAAATAPIAQLADRLGDMDYSAYQEAVAQRRDQLILHEQFHLARIELNNRSKLSDKVVLERLQLQPGSELTRAELEVKIRQLYALDTFEKVDYHIVSEGDSTVLHLDAVEKSWGPGFFDVKLGLQENFKDPTKLDLGLAFTVVDLNYLGAQWRSELEIGSKKRIYTEFYSPVSTNLKYAGQVGLEYNKQERQVFGVLGGETFVPVMFADNLIHGQLLWHGLPWQEWALGAAYSEGYLQPSGYTGELDYYWYGPYLHFNYDSLDSWSFPTRGAFISAEVNWINEQIENANKSSGLSYHLDWKFPFGWHKHRFNWIGEFGGTDTDSVLPVVAQDLGGFLRLSGYRSDQLSGRYKGFSGLMYFYQLGDYQVSSITAPSYVGMSLEKGGVWDNPEDMDFDTATWAASIFTAVDTSLVGPLVFAGGANENEYSLYLFLGNDF